MVKGKMYSMLMVMEIGKPYAEDSLVGRFSEDVFNEASGKGYIRYMEKDDEFGHRLYTLTQLGRNARDK